MFSVATKFSLEPQSQTLEWHQEIVFECSATSDDSTPVTIYWERDDKPIQYEPGRIGRVYIVLRLLFCIRKMLISLIPFPVNSLCVCIYDILTL